MKSVIVDSITNEEIIEVVQEGLCYCKQKAIKKNHSRERVYMEIGEEYQQVLILHAKHQCVEAAVC